MYSSTIVKTIMIYWLKCQMHARWSKYLLILLRLKRYVLDER